MVGFESVRGSKKGLISFDRSIGSIGSIGSARSSEQQIRRLGGRGERFGLVGAGRLEHLIFFLLLLRGTVRFPVVRPGQPSDAKLKVGA